MACFLSIKHFFSSSLLSPRRLFLYSSLLATLLPLSGCSSHSAKKSWIEVSVARQTLTLKDAKGVIKSYPVSTSKHGTGQAQNSLKTPLGKHAVIEKVGAGRPWNALFKYGEFTGKYYRPSTYTENTDPILTRIIRLQGLQNGYNAGEGVDTENRRIYIHGTPPSLKPRSRTPKSRGCIRMHPTDITDLYRRIDVGTLVVIRK